MQKNRPVNLDLKTIKMPLPAIVSILHRGSGVVIFVCLALLLWMLDTSLESDTSFEALKDTLDGFFVTMVIWGVVGALLYHMVAGVRHLVMDLGIGETLEGGIKGARIALAVSGLLILVVGIWLW
ncbi:MAG: succinate dehydrogenase, cytochrome b556 subunit [Gammaproteobacteria bacterium]|nr:succinate dehydrogenase, cytochrome b556 subunit [Gammaproteobacteria bacterium]